MEEKETGFIKYRKDEDCVFLELTAGPADADRAQDIEAEMEEFCDLIAWDDEVRVVVIKFQGEIPCPLAEQVAGLKQPVIAAIDGDAVGLGLELALACDIRIATEGASFGLPQIRFGQLPANGGTQRLPRLVGRGRAMEMILTGRMLDTEEALRIGLINRAVAHNRLWPEAVGLAREMATKSPLALSYAKEAVYSGMDLTLSQGLTMEMDLYFLLFSTRDRVEGITAFREKRKPKFEGI